jgi:amino acid adenylation domain-containing protein
MLLHQFLEASAERLPDKIALISGKKRWTYSQIEASSNKLANAMLDQGLQRGDRVVIYLPNIYEAVIGIFATLKAGGVFVPINPSTKQDKLAYILNNCRAKGLLFPVRQLEMVREVASATPSLKFGISCGSNKSGDEEIRVKPTLLISFDEIQQNFPDHRPPNNNIDLDLAGLIYTSGTTGDPKGIMCDHNNMTFAAKSIIQYIHNTEDDIVINVLPLSFDYGLYQLLMVFRFGGTLVLELGFAYPSQILNRILAEKVTGFPGVPTIFSILVQMDLSPFDLRSLRYMTNTAAALSVNHINKIREKFPSVTLFSMYGLSETKRTLYLPPEQLDKRPGSVGIAIPGTEVWIEDELGNHLGPGEVGELVVRGRHVMRGYWDAPAETAKRYRPGILPNERVCYTGDLFKMDEEGFFYFVSRKDDIIKSRGEKVAPKEVENVIYNLKGVTEVAVIGVEDPLLGQSIKAFLVCENNNLTEAQVLSHCRNHLEDFMVPKFIEFRDSLPKNPSGKIQKSKLV